MNDEIYLDINFEHLLSNLFGKSNYHSITGHYKSTTWAKYICKIFDAIEKSIDQNIAFSDNYQKSEFSRICTDTKSKIQANQNINSINHDTILGMSKIIFNLMGKMPDNWDRKVVNHPNHWRIDRHRTINYSQTTRQRANLIMELANHPDYSSGLPSIQDLNRKFYIELGNDEVKFIKWFKDNHPHNYIKMFLP